ncbi:peptidoglycan-binding domain-containing protein [Streptomyces sp. NPDC002838]|uniref:peptidoglycan-binding domain-containing protein n=1 Tax=Streptomyces sp. NPDC002838 TaxID=3154436 RepID=UPI003316BF07
MPMPPDREQSHDGPPLEPVRVLRPRRTDALAELIREFQEGTGRYDSVALPGPPSGAEDRTQELPPVADHTPLAPSGAPRGRVPGLRRFTVAAAVATAALVGFGCAFLLTDRSDGTSAQASGPTPSAEPTPTASTSPPSGATDPDGPGTLREGDSGPEVTDLQQRLRRIPNVYDDGSTSGSYDTVLTEAVARFQLWYGIRGDETGVYGNDTRLALESRTGAE